MSARSFVLLVVLAAICAEFPLTSAFELVKDPGAEIKVTYPNQKTLVLRWGWRLGSEKFSQAVITRYKTKDKDNTDKVVGSMFFDGTLTTKTAYFKLSGKRKDDGYIELTINDITDQGKNEDTSEVNVMKFNYTYECKVTIVGVNKPYSKSTNLIVYVKPTITNAPENKDVVSNKQDVALTCKADGKPKPTIKWEFQSTSGRITSFSEREKLIISNKATGDNFQMSDVGIYKCIAKNNVGEVNASAVVQYTECNTPCSTDDKIAIEMKDLTYSDGYDTKGSDNYKKLKFDIERECMEQYFKAKKEIYSCVVYEFRKGSVVANIKITYPSRTEKPREPLEKAIKTGTFARQRVETDFVSPTSPPTQPTQPTDKSTDKTSDSPDSGKRAKDDTSGLSDGAIIAIVVVFSIIFIVIIVVLIVCMLKRRKPAGSHSKPYQEDGKGSRTAASAPLKSQPYRDPLYDNEPDKPKDVVYADLNFQDRHTNGGGPPPQYTPSSNYAEVKPSQAEQNESGVEWDKSVRDEMWI